MSNQEKLQELCKTMELRIEELEKQKAEVEERLQKNESHWKFGIFVMAGIVLFAFLNYPPIGFLTTVFAIIGIVRYHLSRLKDIERVDKLKSEIFSTKSQLLTIQSANSL